MPELRIDPLTGLRSIVASDRADRPGAGFRVEPEEPIERETDPFAEGHEQRTPPELYALRDGTGADAPGWSVRVVPNLFPVLDGTDGAVAADPLGAGRGQPELLAAGPAPGAHEVIVNAPDPVTTIAALEPDQVERAMDVWRQRMRVHDEAAYVHLIVNEGRRAGASLPHTHAQLYALPFVPSAVARERERFTAHAERTNGRDLLEDLAQEEVRRGERVVAIDDEAVALCPFAARVPFQLMLVPRRPRRRFEDDGPLAARLLRDSLGRLARALGAAPPLNLWVRTAPRDAEHFCWRIDILPRLVHQAGLELGAGVNVNVLAPERAAALLRD